MATLELYYAGGGAQVSDGEWISGAVKHPGAVTRKAQQEGVTVHEWALRHRHDAGKAGQQARLALTLERQAAKRRGRTTDGG